MIEYWLELASKPKYQLTTAEQAWLDIFSLIALGGVGLIVIVVVIIGSVIYEKVKKRRKK